MPPVELSRIVRIAMSPLDEGETQGNGLVGLWAKGLGAIGEFEVTYRGEPASSGYLVDITAIDRAVRACLAPRIRERFRAEVSTGRPTDLSRFLRECAAALAPQIQATLVRLSYRPSPFRTITVEVGSPASPSHAQHDSMTATTHDTLLSETLLTETFEFAASHRLHVAAKSEAENAALFGKCANLHGHGHNYRIEVAVRQPRTADSASGFPLLEATVAREIMGRFDHKHLNLDCAEFATQNPSVENIARVCHDLLAAAFASTALTLDFVRVWETEKTSCRYPA